MKKNDIYPAAIWLGLGIAVTITSYHFRLGSLVSPGPGLMPFLLGIILSICSVPILIRSFLLFEKTEKDKDKGIWLGVQFKKLFLVVGSLIGYIAFFEKIGFVLATFILLLVLFKIVDSQKWRWALIASSLTVLITYFLFVVFLKVELPSGFMADLLR